MASLQMEAPHRRTVDRVKRPGDHCLRLALGLLPLVSLVISVLLGLPFSGWIALGAVTFGLVATAVTGGMVGRAVINRARVERSRGRPLLLIILAAPLPDPGAANWTEQMHDLLLAKETPGERRHLLRNLVFETPSSCATSWRIHLQHSRRLRYRGDDMLLAALLDQALGAPDLPVRFPGCYAVLHAVGMSRQLICRPIRHVPALALARRLLSTRSPELAVARSHARDLLATREQAHLIARGLRRKPLESWPRSGKLHVRMAALRQLVQVQGEKLQEELRAFVNRPKGTDDE